MSIFDAAATNPELFGLLSDYDVSAREVARRTGHSDRSIRRWRRRMAEDGLNPSAPTSESGPTTSDGIFRGSYTETSTHGEFKDVVTEKQVVNDDWSHIFAIFNLNPDNFEVVDDTVRMSTWQQSKRLENGERDVVNLYSYSARFRKLSADAIRPEIVAQWRAELIRDRINPAAFARTVGDGTYLMLVSDPQIGKKGTEEAKENWKRGINEHLQDAHDVRAGAIHVAFQGDEHEGVVNNYANQPHTVELNFTKQLETDYDMRVWTMQQCLDTGLPVSASSVISNHGEWTRNGGKDVMTTRGDNSSTHIARQVKKQFDAVSLFTDRNIDWTIADGDPNVLVNLSGIWASFTHAYIEKGKGDGVESRTKNAIERQILGKTALLAEVPLYFTSHYHHFFMQEFEGRTQFGCPALEAERSSEYMLDQYGVWSPPGMLGMLIGRDTKRGWSNLAIH